MKNISGIKHIILGVSLLFVLTVSAQEFTAGDNITLQISEYALIETNHAPVSLTLNTTTAGEAAGSVSNSDVFIRISSITPGVTDREITARISSGSVPAATYLTLVSADCTTANSGGDLGAALPTPITLSAIDQTIINQISTCYTGTGYNDGYQLTFNWIPLDPATNYSQLASGTHNITVVFTLSPHDGN